MSYVVTQDLPRGMREKRKEEGCLGKPLKVSPVHPLLEVMMKYSDAREEHKVPSIAGVGSQ